MAQLGAQPALIAVAARDAQGHARGPDARAENEALVDRLPQADVRAAAGADVADGGEAGVERALRVDGGADGFVGRRLRHGLDEGVAGAFAGDVGVGVDQAGEDRRGGQVDDFGAGRPGEAVLDRRDAVAFDDDRDLFTGGVGHPVDQASGVDDDAARSGGRRRRTRLTGRGRLAGQEQGNCCAEETQIPRHHLNSPGNAEM